MISYYLQRELLTPLQARMLAKGQAAKVLAAKGAA